MELALRGQGLLRPAVRGGWMSRPKRSGRRDGLPGAADSRLVKGVATAGTKVVTVIRIAVALVAALAVMSGPPSEADAASPPRVLSLGQCSDQYVLALAPRSSIVGLSPRVGDRDSYLRAQSAGLPRRRPSVETVLASRPDIVVYWWLGDARLARALEQQRIRVVRVDEADNFETIRANVRRVAAALGRGPQGEALITHMDEQLRAARGAWKGRSALYLTSGGFTAGPGTLIDAILRAAGLHNAARAPGYQSVSLEHLAADPPDGLVLGYFDAADVGAQQWGPGRHDVLRRLIRRRTIGSLSPAVSGCPAWFAGDAVESLARGAQRP
jgi:iron complex transport system substrate-binding protein